MHPIIAGEIRKIEALLEGYLGLPPDTINLNTFQIDRFKSIAPSIRRTVERAVSVASLPNASQADIAFVVNASDFIEQEVGKPRVPKIIRPLYTLETKINERPAVNLCRHLASIGLSFYGIAYCNSDTLEGSQIAYRIFLCSDCISYSVPRGALNISTQKHSDAINNTCFDDYWSGDSSSLSAASCGFHALLCAIANFAWVTASIAGLLKRVAGSLWNFRPTTARCEFSTP